MKCDYSKRTFVTPIIRQDLQSAPAVIIRDANLGKQFAFAVVGVPVFVLVIVSEANSSVRILEGGAVTSESIVRIGGWINGQ